MKNINVVSKLNNPKECNDVYIGRGSILGNPFTSKKLSKTKAKYKCATKEESIKKYNTYILDKIEKNDAEIIKELNRISNLAKVRDINLVCYCKNNNKCHGNIIKNIIIGRLIREELSQ